MTFYSGFRDFILTDINATYKSIALRRESTCFVLLTELNAPRSKHSSRQQIVKYEPQSVTKE